MGGNFRIFQQSKQVLSQLQAVVDKSTSKLMTAGIPCSPGGYQNFVRPIYQNLACVRSLGSFRPQAEIKSRLSNQTLPEKQNRRELCNQLLLVSLSLFLSSVRLHLCYCALDATANSCQYLLSCRISAWIKAALHCSTLDFLSELHFMFIPFAFDPSGLNCHALHTLQHVVVQTVCCHFLCGLSGVGACAQVLGSSTELVVAYF